MIQIQYIRMRDYLRKKWRLLHVSKEFLRINRSYRFSKKKFRLINISERRPNLIILGSQKCGTTSLFHYLNHHSEIALSSPFKESGLYMFDEWTQNYFNK